MSENLKTAKLLRIFLDENSRKNGHITYQAVLNEAHRLQLSGATVLRGIAGFCAHSAIHSASVVDLSSDLPIVIEIIDQEENLNKLLPFIDENITEGLVTIEDVKILRYFSLKRKNGKK